MQVVSGDGVKRFRERELDDGSWLGRTDYFGDGKQIHDGPQAFLVEYHAGPGAVIGAHFHHVRQFQVIVRGDGGRLGKRPVPPVTFHYTDPSSPYGPIVPGADGTIAFFTLRPKASPGVFYMPSSRRKLRARAGRNIVVNVSD